MKAGRNGCEIEYTTLDTLQSNQCIEQSFSTLFNCIQVMLNSRKFLHLPQKWTWVETANAATLLENNLITSKRELSQFQPFCQERKE